jgi:hypothetical protein
MRKIGGPQIKNIVRTETQDGKSLLDAHFAHATALVKRWLRTIVQNKQVRLEYGMMLLFTLIWLLYN